MTRFQTALDIQYVDNGISLFLSTRNIDLLTIVQHNISNYVAASQDLSQTHRNVVRNTRNSYNTVIAAVSAIKALKH